MITKQVSYSVAEKALTDAYNSLPKNLKTGNNWGSDEYNLVRKAIKDHYLKEQAYRCCYCHQLIRVSNGRAWDAEHIVPKSLNPEFMFEPYNLAVSCIDCNTAKKAYQPLKRPRARTYPLSSDEYEILHPHFDTYSENIQIHCAILYSPKTLKGEKTIAICRLTRFSYEYGGLPDVISGNQDLIAIMKDLMDSDDLALQNLKIAELYIHLSKKYC